MVTQNFKISKKDFNRKPHTFFQRTLRVFLRCYTIRDIMIDDANFIVIFKKSHKISGIKMEDPKEYEVKYEVLESEDPKEVIIKLIV